MLDADALAGSGVADLAPHMLLESTEPHPPTTGWTGDLDAVGDTLRHDPDVGQDRGSLWKMVCRTRSPSIIPVPCDHDDVVVLSLEAERDALRESETVQDGTAADVECVVAESTRLHVTLQSAAFEGAM